MPRTPEVVDRDGVVAALSETHCELFVEAVQAAHVGQDDDAECRSARRVSPENAAKRLPSRRVEHEVVVRDRRARDDGDRRQGVEVVAHGRPTLTFLAFLNRRLSNPVYDDRSAPGVRAADRAGVAHLQRRVVGGRGALARRRGPFDPFRHHRRGRRRRAVRRPAPRGSARRRDLDRARSTSFPGTRCTRPAAGRERPLLA